MFKITPVSACFKKLNLCQVSVNCPVSVRCLELGDRGLSTVSISGQSCPLSVRCLDFLGQSCPLSFHCLDFYEKCLSAVCLSRRTRTGQNCLDFFCLCSFNFVANTGRTGANCSHWTANSANSEQCEQSSVCEQCEQRTVRTAFRVRTVRTANRGFFVI